MTENMDKKQQHEEKEEGRLIWVVETNVIRRTLVDMMHKLDDVDTRKNENKQQRIYSTMFSPHTVRPLIERQDNNKYVVAMTSTMYDRLLAKPDIRVTAYQRHSFRDFPKDDELSSRSLYVVLPPFVEDGKNDFKRHMNCVQWNLYQKLEELSKIGILPNNQPYKVIFRHRDDGKKFFAFINFTKAVTDNQIIDCRIMLDHSPWVRNTFPRCLCRFARPSSSSNRHQNNDQNNDQNNNNNT